jgi:hypothetical protein
MSLYLRDLLATLTVTCGQPLRPPGSSEDLSLPLPLALFTR